MRNKAESYLGFARKSGNLVYGAGTCEISMAKRKAYLLIIASDAAENTKKKMISKAEGCGVAYRIYSTSDELSRMTGAPGRSVFAVTDKGFADMITKEIDLQIKEVLG